MSAVANKPVLVIDQASLEFTLLPEGTQVIYAGHALFGYVVYPGNWKALHGLA